MTGIVCAQFKDELFMFADGRVCEDDFVFTDNDDKIIKVDDNTLLTMCGDATIIEPILSLMESDTLETNNIKEIIGYGCCIILTSEGLTTVDIDNQEVKEMSKNGISKYKMHTLPTFYGSGKRSLSGSFYALGCDEAKTRKDFLNKMAKCYDAACKRVASMGPLQQVESIKLDKGK